MSYYRDYTRRDSGYSLRVRWGLWRCMRRFRGYSNGNGFIMQTRKSVEENSKNFSNPTQNLNPKEFLTTLEKLKSISDYQNLGFTLKSLCKVTQTALLAKISFPNYTEHNQWDLYNILQLMRSLIPEEELELLDKINS